MFAPLHLLGIFVIGLFKLRRRLEAENLFLRHQLSIALRRSPSRLRLRGSDRALLVWMTCHSRKSYPRVAIMQSGQDWSGDDGPRSLYGSSSRRILAQPQVRARLIVIERIQSQEPSQMPFAIDQDVI
jgi:hypothetical protein